MGKHNEGRKPLTLSDRCAIHAHKMDEDGWHVTANVLWIAAETIDEATRMTADEYRAALKTLGLSQVGAARFLGVHEVTGRRWAKDGAPEPVARFLRLMIALKFTPEYVERVLGEGQ